MAVFYAWLRLLLAPVASPDHCFACSLGQSKGSFGDAPRLSTVVEAGFPQLVIEEWVGWVVKSGTPNEIVVRLNEATNKALAKPSVREALAKIATEPASGSPAEFGTFVKSEIALWTAANPTQACREGLAFRSEHALACVQAPRREELASLYGRRVELRTEASRRWRRLPMMRISYH
jgi:hypothetical protein